jgi:hypothetical protein
LFGTKKYFCKEKKMKIAKQALAALSAIVVIMALIGCAGGPKVKVVEMENKGSSMGLATPEWIKTYTAHGITRVQSQPDFKDKYCIIGEESNVNKQFALAWADNFSAQQRIGAMLRTNIASEYQARVQGAAQSQGGANSTSSAGTSSGEYKQEINNIITAIVNVSYSGAQREADWWSLRRRYDPDQKDVYSDEYTAYVLYTFPKAELNRQVAYALETSVSKDSMLYDITIDMARQILQNGLADWVRDYTTAVTASTTTASVQTAPVSTPAAAPAPAATPAPSLKNGTYTFMPRPRAKKAGMPADAYIIKIVADGRYMIFNMTNVERGTSGRASPGYWYINYNVLLTNLDRPSQTWRPVGHQDTAEGELLSFEGVTATRLSLECDWNGTTIFEEIILGEPDR